MTTPSCVHVMPPLVDRHVLIILAPFENEVKVPRSVPSASFVALGYVPPPKKTGEPLSAGTSSARMLSGAPEVRTGNKTVSRVKQASTR